MDRSRRLAPVLLRTLCALLLIAALVPACERGAPLPTTDEIEAQLRHDPDRPGRVGQLVGVQTSQRAMRIATAASNAPDERCALALTAQQRWTAELSLLRRRGETIAGAWTETRTLDITADAVAMTIAANFRTEIGTSGERAGQWVVTPAGSFIATPGAGGDIWTRRQTEESERARLISYAEGMLPALMAATGGWTARDDGWGLGDDPLLCGPMEHRAAFGDRFVGGATSTTASLGVVRDGGRVVGRTLEVTWSLSDRSTLTASYQDRQVAFDGEIHAPERDELVSIDRDRSLAEAQRLFTELAREGLAEVASATDTAPEPQ